MGGVAGRERDEIRRQFKVGNLAGGQKPVIERIGAGDWGQHQCGLGQALDLLADQAVGGEGEQAVGGKHLAAHAALGAEPCTRILLAGK